jgi:hypothetical protein
MPNKKSEMTANYVTQTLKDHGLLTKCVAFSGDNMNSNLGGINCFGNKNVFHALKHELNKELANAGCPAHNLHNSTQHGADTLPVDTEGRAGVAQSV